MPAAAPIHVVIEGQLASALVRVADLVITDVINEEPNTATLTVNQTPHAPATAAFYPPAFDAAAFVTTPVPTRYPAIRRGQPIEISRGTMAPDARIFAGEIVVVQQVYEGDRPELVAYHLSCTDYTRALNRRKVTKSYPTQSATAIVLDLMASRAVDGFTTTFVAANLPAVAIDFTFEDMNRALTRLANRIGGYWYVDYVKALHFFLEEPGDVPAPLVPGERFADLRFETDLTQVRTRVLVEGVGTTVLTQINPGETSAAVVYRRHPGRTGITRGAGRDADGRAHGGGAGRHGDRGRDACVRGDVPDGVGRIAALTGGERHARSARAAGDGADGGHADRGYRARARRARVCGELRDRQRGNHDQPRRGCDHVGRGARPAARRDDGERAERRGERARRRRGAVRRDDHDGLGRIAARCAQCGGHGPRAGVPRRRVAGAGGRCDRQHDAARELHVLARVPRGEYVGVRTRGVQRRCNGRRDRPAFSWGIFPVGRRPRDQPEGVPQHGQRIDAAVAADDSRQHVHGAVHRHGQ
jgi:hypothetical protein